MRDVVSLIALCSALFTSMLHAAPPIADLKLLAGFRIAVFAEVEDPRQLALGANGTVYAGSMQAGKVVALRDIDGDGDADRQHTIAEELEMPSGVAYRDGALYVGAVNRILRFDDIDNRLEQPPRPVVVTQSLPRDRHHGWKYLGFGPDGMLYVPVGAPCNICLRSDPRYAAILRMEPRSGRTTVYAAGIRNSVGFTWHPTTRQLWFTDNGRDMLGDNVPPEELNVVTAAGQHFGYPYRHGRSVEDPEYGKRRPAHIQTRAPALEIQAHSAALGVEFYTGNTFPARYRGALFIAEHGSWNRTPEAGPVGYRVSVAWVDGERGVRYEPFIEGFLQGASAWGRPNDVLQLPDGSLLISDDGADVIYRVSYAGG